MVGDRCYCRGRYGCCCCYCIIKIDKKGICDNEGKPACVQVKSPISGS